MEYREFGKTGLKPSILGFGMMRLPKNEDGTLNEQWAIETLRGAIDNGLTYVDTAYAYKDSERVTGLCLQDGYREKVTLATKLPVWMVNNQEDFDRVLAEEHTIIGCLGCEHELFNHAALVQCHEEYRGIMQETCVTVTVMEYMCRLHS